MRAAVARRYGGPDVVVPQELDAPEPTGDQVLVRVRAATVSTADAAARSGSPWFTRLAFGLFRPRLPVLGSDFAGRVVALGPDARRFDIGDPVFGATNAAMGAHAEYLAVSEGSPIERVPDGIDPVRAAALVDATAMSFLRDSAALRLGQRLLVNGASGAVGSAAVQIAKHVGANVTGTSSARNLDVVRALGADAALDYTELHGHTASYDVVFDAWGRMGYRRARRLLAPDGLYMTTVPSFAILAQMLWTRWFGRRRALVAFTGLRSAERVAADLRETAALAANGALDAPVAASYPLDRVADAHRHVARGKRGHVVLTLG
ncbi:NAD(P)-dependent alcohol dehydrogenase [Leucobacter triazinivorans]|uniref:NAD(P)-dependent alcohol dehydrogenase n=1 Tax=Leucobacter triazinivorans TaxID=1784719 RepID=A0A4P6KGY5_9MICO|nr:NAD(P)-dependent alcohol dehydrogenase [Leucobacter triazinivorans]QBE49777.1 NAD(P)-dependent alcohol dehydrogenase [Leucobacter triazinivorans]